MKKLNKLVALDIINPFSKTLKMDGLKELVERCNNYSCYDKVGHWFYNVEAVLNGEPEPKNFVDYVYEWLVYIDSLRNTKKTINFTLDLSIL
jgi:hypothetical protein